MTTPSNPGSPTSMGGDAQSPGAKEKAQQTAGTAADEGQHVAGVAKDETQRVAAEARHQAQNLMGDAKAQIDDQSRTQRDRLVSTLRTLSDDLEQMASRGERPGMATDAARQVADKARQLSTQLDGREPSELLDEVRRFARRKPGTFLFGAVAAGMLAGRLTRGAKDAQSSGHGSAPAEWPVRETTLAGTDYTGVAPAGETYPVADPGYSPGVASPAPAVPRPGAPGSVTPANEPFADDPARRDVL